MEFNHYEALDDCQPSNMAPTAPIYEQRLPEMDTMQSTPYAPLPDYNQKVSGPSASHPANMIHPAPYFMGNPEMFQKPPEYTPPYPGSGISGPIPPGMGFPPPPPLTGSPEGPMNHGIMPVPQYPMNSHFPSPGYSTQGMVVTTQATAVVVSSPGPGNRDYLAWSILNTIFCCFAFGLVALIFSIQTRSANQYGDVESGRRKSRTALAFNIVSMVVGIALIVGLAVYYSLFYRRYYYSYSYYG